MNPILSREIPVPFRAVLPEHVEPGLREALERADAELEALVGHEGPRTYENTLGALEALTEKLERAFIIAATLNAVRQTPELRSAYDRMLPEVTGFFAKLPTHERMWRALEAYAATDDAAALQGIRRRHLDKTLREFKRYGANLPAEQKARVEAIQTELAKLSNTFQNNVLDGTNAFELVFETAEPLAGLPPSALRLAQASAEAKGVRGYRLTLQQPSYFPVMQHAHDRELRRRLFHAYVERGMRPEGDNRPLIGRILALRQELARLLGFETFAHLQMEERMVQGPAAALGFERDLRESVRPYLEEELAELEALARDELGYDRLEPWDLLYVTEIQRQRVLHLDEEELRRYFPAERVLGGLFGLAERLFGIRIEEADTDTGWHDDVRYYHVHGEDGDFLGAFFADWHPREDKRGGAWKSGIVSGGPRDGGFAPNLALIAANVTPPEPGKQALLNHREVETLFHEFGHLLHHMLSRVEVGSLSGTRVARDFVELPSQIMENWTWEREALDLFARHVDTDEPIPDDLFDKLQRVRTFGGIYRNAHHVMRQLALGTVDLELHARFDPSSGDDPVAYGNDVLSSFHVRWDVAHEGFLATFTHLFAGGYAAGYYSYMWCEVLEADAFDRFLEEGLLSREVGRELVDAVLSRGDGAEPEELFRAFRGRPPSIEPLLAREFGAREPVGKAGAGSGRVPPGGARSTPPGSTR